MYQFPSTSGTFWGFLGRLLCIFLTAFPSFGMSGTDFSRCLVLVVLYSSAPSAWLYTIFSSSFALLSALPSLHLTKSLYSSCPLSLFSLCFSLYCASFFTSFFNLSWYFLLLQVLVKMATNKIKIADWTQCPRWPTRYSASTMQHTMLMPNAFCQSGGASWPPKTSLAFVAVFTATKMSPPQQK